VVEAESFFLGVHMACKYTAVGAFVHLNPHGEKSTRSSTGGPADGVCETAGSDLVQGGGGDATEPIGHWMPHVCPRHVSHVLYCCRSSCCITHQLGERSKPDVPMTSVALAIITQPVTASHGGQDRRRPAQQGVRGGGAGCF
jgi:hypothetical protein